MLYRIGLFIAIFLVGCSTETKQENTLSREYFYPATKEKQANILIDTLQPLDERVFVYHTAKFDESEHIFLEKYVQGTRLIEGFIFTNEDSVIVKEHMVIDRLNRKSKAQTSAFDHLPYSLNDESYFHSRFPSHLDSVIAVYESKKNCIVKDTVFEFKGIKHDAVVFRDSVKLSMYNPITKDGKSRINVQDLMYAKDLGLVSISVPNSKIHFQLSQVLNQQEWELLLQK